MQNFKNSVARRNFSLKREKLQAGGFTLAEILITTLIFALVSTGIIYGYVQSNRMAIFSAQSMAAQSYASQAAEQARAANWRPRDLPATNGPGTMDELPPCTNITSGTNLILDLPASGPGAATLLLVTNILTVTTVSTNPSVRQIRSDTIWAVPLSGLLNTNTTILLRAPDQ